jgi:hypothetical protein
MPGTSGLAVAADDRTMRFWNAAWLDNSPNMTTSRAAAEV